MNTTLKNEYLGAIPTGAFPGFFILSILPGNSGCHKGCWGSGSFSLPRFIRADSNNPCFLGSNNIPTRMLYKDRGACVPIELKLVSGRKSDHTKITRKRVAA